MLSRAGGVKVNVEIGGGDTCVHFIHIKCCAGVARVARMLVCFFFFFFLTLTIKDKKRRDHNFFKQGSYYAKMFLAEESIVENKFG